MREILEYAPAAHRRNDEMPAEANREAPTEPHLRLVGSQAVEATVPNVREEVTLGRTQINWCNRIFCEEEVEKISEMTADQRELLADALCGLFSQISINRQTEEKRQQRLKEIRLLISGKSFKEISEETGKSRNGVDVSLRDAAERIKAEFSEDKIKESVTDPKAIIAESEKNVAPIAEARRPASSREHSPRRVIYESDPAQKEAIDRLCDHELLTAEEEVELAKQVEIGNLDAKNRLVRQNMRLVVLLARNHRHVSHDLGLMDLISEGTTGLIRAAEKYDYRKGFRFSTYATIWIRQALQRSTQNLGNHIRLPVHMHQKYDRIREVEKQLEAEQFGAIIDEEVCKRAGVTPEELSLIRRTLAVKRSLNSPLGDGPDSTTLEEVVPSRGLSTDREAIENVYRETIQKSVDMLPDLDAKIVNMRFGLTDDIERSVEAVAKELGISESHVKSSLKKTLNYLKDKIAV